MKILDADAFYDVVNETFSHDVISKEDILNLIDEMAVECIDVKNNNMIKTDEPSAEEIIKLRDELYKLIEYDEWAGREYGENRVDYYFTAINLLQAGYYKHSEK